MAVGIKGGTTFGTTEDKGLYIRAMLARAVPKMFFDQFSNKDFIPARGGTFAEWRRLSSFAATTTALTEGTSGSETTPTVVNVTATVNQYGQFFRASEILASQGIDDLKAESAEMLGEAMGTSLDTLTRNVYTGGTTVQYASTAGSRGGVGSGMRFNSAEVREAVATLETNDAPLYDDGAYKSVIHPRTKADLYNDTNFLNAQQYAGVRGDGNSLFTGKIGRYLGVDWFVSSQGQISTSLGLSGADVYYTVVFGKDAVGVVNLSAERAQIIYKEPGSGGATGDPLNQVWSIGWKAAHAAARLNENFLVRVEHTTALGVGG